MTCINLARQFPMVVGRVEIVFATVFSLLYFVGMVAYCNVIDSEQRLNNAASILLLVLVHGGTHVPSPFGGS